MADAKVAIKIPPELESELPKIGRAVLAEAYAQMQKRPPAKDGFYHLEIPMRIKLKTPLSEAKRGELDPDCIWLLFFSFGC